MRVARATLVVLALVAALAASLVWTAAPPASATAGAPGRPDGPAEPVPLDAEDEYAAETTLAERYVPQMRLVAQEETCGPGEPYFPADVEKMFSSPDIALRGPWSSHDLVEVGPTAETIGAGLRGYQLDMPGDPLQPGCEYEKWFDRTWGDSTSAVVYAHVARQKGVDDRIALAYYFFYPYNDYNNKHEADWERIQLEFPAGDPVAALEVGPDRAVYSQHYGSEEAAWGSDKLEVFEGRPVVYVSAGSHASQFQPGLYMGNSAAVGLGCDITIGPHDDVRPGVVTIPSDPALASERYPWIDYRGRWGEAGSLSFYDGPTGPASKSEWRRPFAWSQDARPNSIAVPGGEAAGTRVTEFYCGAVSAGSDAFRSFVVDPWPVLVVLGALVLLLVLLARRHPWRSTALPVRTPRTGTQVVHATWRLARERPGTMARLAVPSLVLTLAATALTLVSLLTPVPWWVGTLGGVAVVPGLVVVAGATSLDVAGLDEGRRPASGAALATAARRCLLGAPALLVAALVTVLSATSIFLLPLALVMLGVWATLVPVIVLEERSGLRALPRSVRLARGSVPLMALLVRVGVVVATTAGALLAAVLYLALSLPFLVLNLVPLLTLGLLWPFLSLSSTYCYFSATAAADGTPGPADRSAPATTP